jgi:hypothetical protein
MLLGDFDEWFRSSAPVGADRCPECNPGSDFKFQALKFTWIVLLDLLRECADAFTDQPVGAFLSA